LIEPNAFYLILLKKNQNSVLPQDTPKLLDILLVSDVKGEVSFRAFGCFFLGKLNILSQLEGCSHFKDMKMNKVDIHSTELSSNLNKLSLVVNLGLIDTPEIHTYLLTTHTSLLCSQSKEITSISWQCLSISELMIRITTLIEDLKKKME